MMNTTTFVHTENDPEILASIYRADKSSISLDFQDDEGTRVHIFLTEAQLDALAESITKFRNEEATERIAKAKADHEAAEAHAAAPSASPETIATEEEIPL